MLCRETVVKITCDPAVDPPTFTVIGETMTLTYVRPFIAAPLLRVKAKFTIKHAVC